MPASRVGNKGIVGVQRLQFGIDITFLWIQDACSLEYLSQLINEGYTTWAGNFNWNNSSCGSSFYLFVKL